jgi:hypothetical protein
MLRPIDPMNQTNYQNTIGECVIIKMAQGIAWKQALSNYQWNGAGWECGIARRLDFHNQMNTALAAENNGQISTREILESCHTEPRRKE